MRDALRSAASRTALSAPFPARPSSVVVAPRSTPAYGSYATSSATKRRIRSRSKPRATACARTGSRAGAAAAGLGAWARTAGATRTAAVPAPAALRKVRRSIRTGPPVFGAQSASGMTPVPSFVMSASSCGIDPASGSSGTISPAKPTEGGSFPGSVTSGDDEGMRFGIDIAPLGELADPLLIAELGRSAEAAGWDGLSIWDSLGLGMGTYAPDPFVALAGVAAATSRLRLILAVAVLGRRRPQLVAQSAATLDRLSGGRFILGMGRGGDPGDLTAFGDAAPASELVARMDAGLRVIEPWLRGEAVRMDVPGASESPVVVGPPPVQRPRPPMWLAGCARAPCAVRRRSMAGWVSASARTARV